MNHKDQLQEEKAIERMRANTVRLMDLQERLIGKVEETLDSPRNVQPGEWAKALRDIADTTSKTVDKLLSLSGRPTQITEHRDPMEVLRSLKQGGITVYGSLGTPLLEGEPKELPAPVADEQ